MHQPKGFVSNPYLVFKLKKSLYGLKQAPRAWYAKIDGFFLSLSFVQWMYDPNVYLKLIHGYLMIIIFICGLPIDYMKFKERYCLLEGSMNHAFSMTYLGLLIQ